MIYLAMVIKLHNWGNIQAKVRVLFLKKILYLSKPMRRHQPAIRISVGAGLCLKTFFSAYEIHLRTSKLHKDLLFDLYFSMILRPSESKLMTSFLLYLQQDEIILKIKRTNRYVAVLISNYFLIYIRKTENKATLLEFLPTVLSMSELQERKFIKPQRLNMCTVFNYTFFP